MGVVDVTKGSLAVNLIRLAWPSVLQAILANLYSVNDFYFVAHIKDHLEASAGTTAIAASVGLTIVLYGVHNIVPAGCTAYSAQFKGANDRRSLGLTFTAAFWACLGLSSFIAVFGLCFIHVIAGLTNSGPLVSREIEKFVGVILLASPAFGLLLLIDGFYKSNGDTVFPLKLEICSLLVNFSLNFIFVWHLGWGIAGSASASALSRLLPALYGLRCILRGDLNDIQVNLNVFAPVTDASPPPPPPSPSSEQTLISRALAMMRLGIFQSGSDFLYGAVFTVMIRLAGAIGTAQQAGLGAGMRGLEWISYCVGEGFLVASLTSVGNLIGAGDQRRATIAALLASVMSSFVGAVMGLPFIFFSQPIASLLSNDAEIIRYCAMYIRYQGMVSFAVGFELASYGAFVGAGKASGVFAVNGSMNVIRIPITVLCLFGKDNFFRGLAYAFGLGSSKGLALQGDFRCLCWVIMGSAVLKAVLFAIWLNVRYWTGSYFKDSSLLGSGSGSGSGSGDAKLPATLSSAEIELGSSAGAGAVQKNVQEGGGPRSYMPLSSVSEHGPTTLGEIDIDDPL